MKKGNKFIVNKEKKDENRRKAYLNNYINPNQGNLQ